MSVLIYVSAPFVAFALILLAMSLPYWPPLAKWHLIIHCLLIVRAALCGGVELAKTETHQFPRGITANTEALVCPNVSGFEIAGVGRGAIDNSANMGRSSILLREGDSEAEMVRITGADHTLRDFSLYGSHPKRPSGTRPQTGVLVTFAKGTGTGSHLFERMHVYGVRAAFQFGQKTRENMCDSTRIRGPMTVSDCDYVVNQVNDMAISNVVEGVESSNITSAFYRVAAGGSCAIRDCSINHLRETDHCFIYHFGPDIGSNAWTYRLDGFKADRQCGPRLGIVKMDKPKCLGVIVTGVQFAHDGYGDGYYLWDLQDGARIIIHGGSNILQRHSIFVTDHARYQPPEIVATGVDQCCDPKEMVAPGSGPVRLTLTSCYRPDKPGSQSRFDFAGVVEGEK